MSLVRSISPLYVYFNLFCAAWMKSLALLGSRKVRLEGKQMLKGVLFQFLFQHIRRAKEGVFKDGFGEKESSNSHGSCILSLLYIFNVNLAVGKDQKNNF